MPSLFVLPRQVPLTSSAGLLAGAKLTFSATGSSTLQNTYQDIDLTVAHTNPVEADANGVFPMIYLDPTLPDYRVKLTTSADVLIYQEDDVPSNQNTAQTFRLKSATPELIFEETDASADNGKWRIQVNGEQMLIDIGNDAESSWVNVASLTRIGTFPNVFNFAGQYLKVDGDFVATQTSGSFTATLTGFTTTVTGTVKWFRSGTKVGFFVPSTISGTSNATSMGMDGMPVDLLMSSNSAVVLCRVTDNSSIVLGAATIRKNLDGSPGISFGVGANGANFTNSGTKGLPAGTYIVFDSDGLTIA